MTGDVYCGIRIKSPWPQRLRNGLWVTWEDVIMIARQKDQRNKEYREQTGSRWRPVPMERCMNMARDGVPFTKIGKEYSTSAESVSKRVRGIVRDAAEEAQGLACHTLSTLPWDAPETQIRMRIK